MEPILIAIKGKGIFNTLRRAVYIVEHYGVTPDKLNHRLAQFIQTVNQFGCKATIPATIGTLERHSDTIRQLQEHGIELAVHGYRHIDHSELSLEEQSNSLALSIQVLEEHGIKAQGFRSPYLRWNPTMLAALRQKGFSYDNSQAVAWEVLEGHECGAYQQALRFYRAQMANDTLSMPSLEDGLVRIPYSLPDDEALIDRIRMNKPEQIGAIWQAILERTYELGEIFTLGLHPERFPPCREALIGILERARRYSPKIWVARLDEVANWWRERASTRVEIADAPDRIHLSITGPNELAILARGVEVEAPTKPWMDPYQQVMATDFDLVAPQRPFIGVSPSAAPQLALFLKQLGYIVEFSDQAHRYACYFDQAEFEERHKRPLLSFIEQSNCPLVKVGRWPNGARSALCVTGDIDALTVCDYGLRSLGR